MDDLKWIDDIKPNIWLSYNFLMFDVKPIPSDLEKIINDALNTEGLLNNHNKSIWEDSARKVRSIKQIIQYYKEYGYVYLRITDVNELMYGTVTKPDQSSKVVYYNTIKTIFVKEQKEDDGLDWIREVKPFPITNLYPGDVYMITKLGDEAQREWLKDIDLRKLDISKQKFILDDSENFKDESDNHTTLSTPESFEVWVDPIEEKYIGGWINVNTIMVIKVG